MVHCYVELSFGCCDIQISLFVRLIKELWTGSCSLSPWGRFSVRFFPATETAFCFFVFFYDGIQNRYFQPNLIRTKWFLCLNLSRRSGVTREKQKERAEAEQTSSSNRKKHWVWTYLWFFRSMRSWHLFRPLGCNWKQFNTDKEDYKQRQLFSITALVETIS